MTESLEYYKYQRYQTSLQIGDRRAQNKVLREQVARLEDAYKKLSYIKHENAKLVKNSAKLKKVAGNVKWYGYSKLKFDSIMNNHVSDAANDFYNSIDEVLDEIGRALDAKRGEYDTGVDILNRLNRNWNYFNGIVRNWFN